MIEGSARVGMNKLRASATRPKKSCGWLGGGGEGMGGMTHLRSDGNIFREDSKHQRKSWRSSLPTFLRSSL